jgi:hypothetical protein
MELRRPLTLPIGWEMWHWSERYEMLSRVSADPSDGAAKREFLGAVRGGGPVAVACPFGEAALSVEIIEAAFASAHQGEGWKETGEPRGPPHDLKRDRPLPPRKARCRCAYSIPNGYRTAASSFIGCMRVARRDRWHVRRLCATRLRLLPASPLRLGHAPLAPAANARRGAARWMRRPTRRPRWRCRLSIPAPLWPAPAATVCGASARSDTAWEPATGTLASYPETIGAAACLHGAAWYGGARTHRTSTFRVCGDLRTSPLRPTSRCAQGADRGNRPSDPGPLPSGISRRRMAGSSPTAGATNRLPPKRCGRRS